MSLCFGESCGQGLHCFLEVFAFGLRSRIYPCEQKTKLTVAPFNPYPPKGHFFLSFPDYFLGVGIPLHPPEKNILPFFCSYTAQFQGLGQKPKGHLKMAVECQEASQLCGSCHLRERCLFGSSSQQTGRGKGKTERRRVGPSIRKTGCVLKSQ